MNKIRLSLLLLFVLLLSSWAYPERAAVFPQLANPRKMIVDGHQIVITDYPHIYIYSLEDFRLVKKFGAKGRGPGEFYIDKMWLPRKERGLVISYQDNNLYIDSMAGLSIFSRDGEFSKIIKKHPFRGGYWFKVLGKNYIGYATLREKKELFATVNLYDSNLKHVKEIYRCHLFRKNLDQKDYNFFEFASMSVLYVIADSKVFIVKGGAEAFLIQVFDEKGEKLYDIEHESEKIRVPADYIKKVRDYYRIKFKRGLELNLKYVQFPGYFPAIRCFTVAEGKIYVFTYKRDGMNHEMVILDIKGEQLGRRMFPAVEKNPEYFFPYAIHKGKFYQVIENESSEEWELHIFQIK